MSGRQLLRRAVLDGFLLAGLAACGGEATIPVAELRPLPEVDFVGCDEASLTCNEVRCLPAEDDACPDDPDLSMGTYCGTEVKGPYAVADGDPDHAIARRSGPCCYVLSGSDACEGRPLVIEHEARFAAVVTRADWC